MSVDLATVKRVARLARLAVTEEEAERMTGELNGILGWIEQLQAVDTDGVEPMAGGTPEGIAAMPLRDDVVTDGGQAPKVLANAPDREGEYFGVPKVVE